MAKKKLRSAKPAVQRAAAANMQSEGKLWKTKGGKRTKSAGHVKRSGGISKKKTGVKKKTAKDLKREKRKNFQGAAVGDKKGAAMLLGIRKRKKELGEKLGAHFKDIRSANGQPLNDKRGGHKILNKWSKQSDRLTKVDDDITRRKEKFDSHVSSLANKRERFKTFPEPLKKSIKSGKVKEWEKYPNTFFVKDVQGARMRYLPKKKQLAYAHLSKTTDPAQRKEFASVYNSLQRKINKPKK